MYVRTTDARSAPIETADDMNRLLRFALSRQGDGLLGQIRTLMGAASPTEAPEEAQFQAQLGTAEAFVSQKIPDEPWWQVTVHPATYEEHLVPSRARLREVRSQSTVSIGGWDFPHSDHKHSDNFEDGIQSWTGSGKYEEAHRLYTSGLFVWRRRPWEDLTPGYEGRLNYLGAIRSMTEYFLFASRFAALLREEDSYDVTVVLRGLEGHKLWEDRGILWDEYVSGAREFRRSVRLPLAELRTDHLQIAVHWAKDLFELFNADISESVIGDWQQKFLDRRV
jgi:hypothetical protein